MNQPKAAGCIVTTHDIPLVIQSIACYSCFIVYGACVASLGAGLPALAAYYGRSEAEFGVVFTSRGVGYFLGTIGSAALLEHTNITLSKTQLTCLAVFVSGVSTGFICLSKSYYIAILLLWIQGVGFGGIDTMANCALPDLWGTRVQPWMQALHACFGFGAIIGPALVGAYGFNLTFIVLSVSSLFPIIAIILQSFFTVSVSSPDAQNSYELVALPNKQQQNTLPLTSMPSISNDQQAECGLPAAQLAVSTTTPEDDNNDDAGKLISCDTVIDIEAENDQSKTGNTDDIRKNDVVKDIPISIRALFTVFFFVYVGTESGYGSWISTFVLQEKVTVLEDEAAYIAAVFWASLTAGRLIAIPVAVVAPTTLMLRGQLLISAVGAVLVLFISRVSYFHACGAAACLGLGLGSIFPLMMTLVTDYGYTMNPSTTTLFVVGSTIGEGLIPVGLGLVMTAAGPMALSYSIFVSIAVLLLIYMVIHISATRYYKSSHQLLQSQSDEYSCHDELAAIHNPVQGHEGTDKEEHVVIDFKTHN